MLALAPTLLLRRPSCDAAAASSWLLAAARHELASPAPAPAPAPLAAAAAAAPFRGSSGPMFPPASLSWFLLGAADGN